MKKSILLTSMLALAACAGGSTTTGGGIGGNVGGGTNAEETVTTPGSGLSVMSQTAIDSNHDITKMTSEILVAVDGVSADITRGASGRVTYNGKEYTTYRLNDVTFLLSSITDHEEDGNDMVKLDIDETTGEVIGLSMEDANGPWQYAGRHEGNVFTVGDNTYELNLLGDLRYADFGYLNMTEIEDGKAHTEHMAMAGGYDVKSIKKENIAKETVFSGRVVGSVFTERNGNGGGGYQPLDTDDAKLTFKDGTETLNMKFSDWYDVTVTAKNGKADIEFAANGKDIDDEFKMTKEKYEDFTAEGHDYGKAGILGQFETGYYGDNGVASEATAITTVRETTFNENGVMKETTFSSAFGGKAK